MREELVIREEVGIWPGACLVGTRNEMEGRVGGEGNSLPCFIKK